MAGERQDVMCRWKRFIVMEECVVSILASNAWIRSLLCVLEGGLGG